MFSRASMIARAAQQRRGGRGHFEATVEASLVSRSPPGDAYVALAFLSRSLRQYYLVGSISRAACESFRREARPAVLLLNNPPKTTNTLRMSGLMEEIPRPLMMPTSLSPRQELHKETFVAVPAVPSLLN